MRIPRPISRLTEAFERLPGIGPKTASRLAFYLLRVPKKYLEDFSQSLLEIKEKTCLCSICFNVTEIDPCPVCSGSERDQSIVCVAEEALDVLALEKTDKFKGVYHVLHGAISPLNNIGPDELYIDQLVKRVKKGVIKEVILAMNPNMEGEATAMYLAKLLKPLGVKLTRLAHGLPVGADLEYTDEVTLARAVEGRQDF